ncbi:hypothetical protein FRC03_007048 [Tulasnella sp. 419]|nr:hypothetical protein FRC03_007048 [Tulasnella sp. 419]
MRTKMLTPRTRQGNVLNLERRLRCDEGRTTIPSEKPSKPPTTINSTLVLFCSLYLSSAALFPGWFVDIIRIQAQTHFVIFVVAFSIPTVTVRRLALATLFDSL